MSERDAAATTKVENLRLAYQQVCASQHAIDDFRAKLLALLPLATGAGIFLLFSETWTDTARRAAVAPYLVVVASFGGLVTLGLFLYEAWGMRSCGALIAIGARLEHQLGVEGKFLLRPGPAAGFIGIPEAGGVVYSAVLAAWVFLGTCCQLGIAGAGGLLAATFLGSLALARVLAAEVDWPDLKRRADLARARFGDGDEALIRLVERLIEAENATDCSEASSLIGSAFTAITRSSGEEQGRRDLLDAIACPKRRVRRELAAASSWRSGSLGVVRSLVTVADLENPDGPGRRYRNLHVLERQPEGWQCVAWQVTALPEAREGEPGAAR